MKKAEVRAMRERLRADPRNPDFWKATDGTPEGRFNILSCLTWPLSSRKVRLFAVACCRRIWPLLTDERLRTAVEVAERFADGLVTAIEREDADRALWKDVYTPIQTMSASIGNALGFLCVDPLGPNYAAAVAFWVTSVLVGHEPLSDPELERQRQEAWTREQRIQVSMLRDIFGNPYAPQSVPPNWRTPTVVSLAQTAYDERFLPAGTLDPDRLSLLADTLQTAGCTDAAILEHLRSPEPHVRGCFLIDSILEKEQLCP